MANPLRALKRSIHEDDPVRRNLLRLVPGMEPESVPEESPAPNPLRMAMSQTAEGIPPPDLSATDYYQSNRTIRPKMDTGIADPTDRAEDYRGNLEAYEPQNESKGKTALRMALGLIAGPAQAIAPLLNRKREDRSWRDREIAQADETIDRGRAAKRGMLQDRLLNAQVDRAEQDPVAKSEPDRVVGGRVLRRQADGSYKSVYEPSAATTDTRPHNPLQRERKNKDGSTTFQLSHDYGKTWVDSEGDAAPPEKPLESPKDVAERRRRYAAAESKFNDLIAEEKAAAQQKDAAFAAYSAAKQRYPENPDIQPDVIAAKKAADDAQAHYGSFWGKKNDAKAEMVQYGDSPAEKPVGKLNINDAAKHFEAKHKRKPTADEVARMQAAIDKGNQ